MACIARFSKNNKFYRVKMLAVKRKGIVTLSEKVDRLSKYRFSLTKYSQQNYLNLPIYSLKIMFTNILVRNRL